MATLIAQGQLYSGTGKGSVSGGSSDASGGGVATPASRRAGGSASFGGSETSGTRFSATSLGSFLKTDRSGALLNSSSGPTSLGTLFGKPPDSAGSSGGYSTVSSSSAQSSGRSGNDGVGGGSSASSAGGGPNLGATSAQSAKAPPTSSGSAQAADGETDWKNTSTDWNTAGNWTAVSGSAPPAPGDVAWFKTVRSTNPNISSSVSIAGLYFNGTGSNNYTVSASTSQTLTLTAFGTTIGAETGNSNAVAIGAENTSGTNTISAPIILAPASGTNSTIFQATGGSLTITGAVSGSGISLTKTGGGTLTLNTATNTYSGGTFVNSGTLSFNTANSLGTGNITLGTSLGGDATLTSSGQLNLTNNIIVASGSGGTLILGTASTAATTSTWSGTLTLNDNVTLTSAQASTNNGLNLTGAIAGAGGITKIGSGLLTLSNSSNSYGGNTSINAGTLKDGANNALPTGTILTVGSVGNSALFDLNGKSQQVAGLLTAGTAGNQTVINTSATNATLTVNIATGTDVFGGVLGNSGNQNFTLDKEGAGTLQLTNTANLYNQGTIINGGTLLIDDNNELGTTGTQITFGGGTLDFPATASAANASTGRPITLNAGGGTIQVDLTADQNHLLTMSGVISGTGALTKSGLGILQLSNANTYSGGTVINAGTIQLSGGSPAGTIGSNTGSLTINNTGIFDLHGVNSTTGNLTGDPGTIIKNNFTTTNTLTIGNGLTGVGGNFQGSIIDHDNVGATGGTTPSGTMAITKTGSGTIELSGTNTYTGDTTISGGGTGGGMLALGSGSSLPGGLAGTGSNPSHLSLNGGVLGVSGTFTRSLGGSGGTVDFNSGGGTDSGFAAFGGSLGSAFSNANNLAVNIGNGTALIWGGTGSPNGTANFLGSGEILVLGNSAANGTVDFQNNLDLNTQNNNPSNTSRIIWVNRSAVAGTTDIDAKVSGIISGATGNGGPDNLIKNGLGTLQLTLTGANTYNGSTTVSAGVLNIQNNTSLGTTVGGTSVTSGAALQIQSDITVGAEALTLNGTGISSTGALRNISGNNVWQGTVTLGSATRINSDAGSLTFNTAANSITGTQNLTLGGAGNGTVAGTITISTGTLTKDGVGRWTLSGTNTYTGTTTVNGGSLFVNNATGSGTGTNTVTVNNSGSTLGGSGTITGSVNVTANTNLSPGASGVGSTGILHTGALTMTATSTLNIDLTSTAAYDRVASSSVALNNANLAVANLSATISIGDKFFIVDNTGAGTNGTFNGLANGGTVTDSNGDTFQINYFDNFDGNANDISLTALTVVPEPSTWVAASLGAVMLIVQIARARSFSKRKGWGLETRKNYITK